MVSKNQAKGVWLALFCEYYGRFLNLEFYQRIKEFPCFEGKCPNAKSCRQKYYRKLDRLVKKYGSLDKAPSREFP